MTKKYQHIFSDGTETNLFRKKPYVKTGFCGLVFSQINAETIAIIGNGGDPVKVDFDQTDHFWFTCQKCNITADVLQVKFLVYADGVIAIAFHWGCPSCGNMGQRKIYVYPNQNESKK